MNKFYLLAALFISNSLYGQTTSEVTWDIGFAVYNQKGVFQKKISEQLELSFKVNGETTISSKGSFKNSEYPNFSMKTYTFKLGTEGTSHLTLKKRASKNNSEEETLFSDKDVPFGFYILYPVENIINTEHLLGREKASLFVADIPVDKKRPSHLHLETRGCYQNLGKNTQEHCYQDQEFQESLIIEMPSYDQESFTSFTEKNLVYRFYFQKHL